MAILHAPEGRSLSHSLVIIKWTWGFFSQHLQLDPTATIKHKRVADSFKSKVKITGKTHNDGTTNKVEIVVPLKYLSNFWITLEMPLITC